MNADFAKIGLCVLLLPWGLCAAGCKSKGIDCSGFVIPTYRFPGGFSETYRRRLREVDATPQSRELLHPALLELPPPVPLAPLKLMPAPNSGEDAMPHKERLPFPPAPLPGTSGNAGTPKKP